jgi:multicomponent K+:H+ antiporter subunit D
MMIALARSGSILFYQVSDDGENDGQAFNTRATTVMIALLMLSPVLVVAAGPMTMLTEQIAEQLSDSRAYIDAVLGQAAVRGK